MRKEPVRYRWGEATWDWCGVAFCLSHYSDMDDGPHSLHVSFLWGNFFIHIPHFLNMEHMEDGYGFSITRECIHLSWGRRSWILNYPWQFELKKKWIRIDEKSWIGNKMTSFWVEMPKGFHSFENEIATVYTFPFTYTLNNGTKQERLANVTCRRSEYRWRWLMWLPWPRKIYTGIDIDFSDEIGERTGSWKGGTTGCGYEMEGNETIKECFERMIRDRRF